MTANRPDSVPGVRRVFLGWDALVLPKAAAELIERYRREDSLDLSCVIVVVPGQRAGRRLIELLVDAAASQNLLLSPPDVVTEGHLPERLYPQMKPFAPTLVQLFAWTAAVRGLAAEDRAALLPHPPGDAESLRWIRLGEMFSLVDAELAADGHDVAAVLKAGAEVNGFADHARWKAIGNARKAYHRSLDELGFWDKHAARLVAVEKSEINTAKEIVLLGTVDLNAVVLKMLAQIAGQVTAFIAAPEREAERFDDFGQLRHREWQAAMVPIRDEDIHFVEGPTEQAAAAAAWLAGLNAEYAVDDVVLGVPDPSVVPALRRRLAREKFRVRWLEEKTLGDTAPFRLLAAAVEYLRDGIYEAFAALVRHPDVGAWLHRVETPLNLTHLDAFHAEHLPARIEAKRLPDTEEGEAIRAAVESVEKWLKPATGKRPLRDWAVAFADVLKAVYAGQGELKLDSDADRVMHAALTRVLGGLDELRAVPEALDLTLTAADAFAVAFDSMAREPIPPLLDPDAIELLGWLELPLDDAAAVLVLSCNDGFVPSASGADPFLPDALRVKLDIEHDARRYARDAYAMTVLAHSKKQFGCVVARRDAEQNPLLPSRLLFACEEPALLSRVRRWVKSDPPPPRIADEIAASDSPFRVPPARVTGRKRDRFRVSEFRTFLACPYRYYLRYIEGLQAVDDAARELDGSAFGSLLHCVLEEWGNDLAWRNCGDAAALEANLHQRLQALTAARFGSARPALRLQLVQAVRRLSAFAHAQIALVHEGWRIVFVERGEQSLTGRFDIGAESVTLLGRIDRIDFHEQENVVRILDYKTSESASKPEKSHESKGEWTDLQLPLYRHLWRSCVGVDVVPETATVELAYFQIPREWDETGVVVAEWDDEQLAAADDRARDVIEKIRAEDFGEPKQPAPKFFEEFAAICLDKRRPPALTDDDENDENGGEE